MPEPARPQKTIGPGEGDRFDFGGLAVCWKLDGSDAGGRFAVVHHPIAAPAGGRGASAW